MSIEQEIESSSGFNSKELLEKISSKLSEKNQEAIKTLQSIETLENAIKEKKEHYRQITEEEMPALFDELGISSITLSTGETIGVEQTLHCGIPAHSHEQAMQWLRDNEHADLIKNELKLNFGKSEDNYIGEFLELAEKLGLRYNKKEAVHPSTLKAFLREQMRSGATIPQDLFGVYIRRVVNVKIEK